MKEQIMDFEDKNRAELYVGFSEVNQALYEDFLRNTEVQDDMESKEEFATELSEMFQEYVENEYNDSFNV